MGSGWRRAFCTMIPRDKQNQSPSPNLSPRSCANFGYYLTDNNDSLITPKLHCKTTTTTPNSAMKSNPSSPRSPFSIFKNTLRLSRNGCGICLRSVKRCEGMAIYTADCSHAFHFPCIADHVTKQGTLTCPVCNSTWRDVPLLSIHTNIIQQQSQIKEDKCEQDKHRKQEETKQQPPFGHLIKTKPFQVTTYDDDEPLLSPTPGVPILEDGENEELENEEFRGFLVNPISSFSDESVINGGDCRIVEVKVMPEVAVVSVGRSHQTHAVVLKVKAPSPAHNSNMAHSVEYPSRRAPFDLVTVLDVSLSMNGAKIQMLKRTMRLVISSLGSADRLSIVAFSAIPKRLLPLQRMTATGQRKARRVIDRLSCSQETTTSVGDALRKAIKVLEDRRERNPVASIILLSDDQDRTVPHNNASQWPGSSHVSSTRFAHMEIPVHGHSCEPAENAFAKCVGGLLSVVVRDLQLQLGLAFGSDPAEISAVYSCNGRPIVLCADSVRLGDLYAEEVRELLVELKVPTSTFWTHHVLSVRCCHRDPANQEMINGREQSLVVPRPQSVRSSMPEIERLRNLFVRTRAIAESRRLMEHNELSSAYHLLSSARALLLQSSLISCDDEYIRGLEAELRELQWRRQYQRQQVIQRCGGSERGMGFVDENAEPLTPTSAWRATERLAKVAKMRESLNRVSDLHGFENARF